MSCELNDSLNRNMLAAHARSHVRMLLFEHDVQKCEFLSIVEAVTSAARNLPGVYRVHAVKLLKKIMLKTGRDVLLIDPS
jgi:hypothetical protein